MGKKDLKLTIDEIVVKKAKEEIPNISKLVEETLRTYLDAKDNDEFLIRTRIKAEEEQINRSQTQIDLLNAQLKLRREAKYGEKTTKNRAWRSIWDNYRNYGTYKADDMEHAITTLKRTEKELNSLLELIKSYGRHLDGLKSQEWDYVKQFEKEL
ncbi:MAG: hypothetical protein LBM02_08090 [Lachnospiraceae bacterium]|nr:hypothetical protein [Lachnospiraceae bacterium]